MSMRLLRWQGPRRTECCRQHLLSILNAWASDWSATAADGVSIAAAPASGVAARMQWWRGSVDSAGVLLALPDGGGVACANRLLSIRGFDASAIVEGVSSEAITELLARLGGDALQQQGWVVEKLAHPPGEAMLAERHGNLGFALGQPLARASLFVDAGWCDKFVPVIGKGEASPLVAREAALLDTRISLSARIELGALSLQDSIGWSVGEVLVTDARADTPVQLLNAARCVATGILSNQADRRALRLLPGINN